MDSPFREYALLFLLGSLSVASLSDIRRMAAQADFAEVWWVFIGVMFAADIGLGAAGIIAVEALGSKWLLFAAFAVLLTSSKSLSVATMDQAALLALLSCLDAPMMAAAIALTFLINEIMKPLLASYGSEGAYPFLPTVFVVNLAMLAIDASELIRAFAS